MSKITKKDLNERLLMVETLLGLHRALPEQISNDQANNAIFRMQYALSSGKELAERKPQLKQLDQSVFDGLDEKWRFAAVDGCTGRAYVYEQKPHFFHGRDYWRIHEGLQRIVGHDYDASNWKNSLIERDVAKELTGSELCKAMLARGDKYVVCFMGYSNDATAEFHESARIVVAHDDKGFYVHDEYYQYAVPINNQGEPLAAAEVGL